MLEWKLEGNKQSKEVVIFLQGWPDNWQVWECLNYKQELKDVALVFINWPNTAGEVTHKWGVDFPQMTLNLKATLDSIPEVTKAEKRTIVAHDWGCFYAYLFDQKYPKFITDLITLDVPAKPELPVFKWVLFILFYQWTLAIAFLIGGGIGKFMTQKMVKQMKYNPTYFDQITGAGNYPYYYLWKNRFSSMAKLSTPFLKGYRPSVPIAYLYGGKKPFHFHGKRWLEYLQKNRENNCEVHQVNSGHWIMIAAPKFLTDLILRRLKPKI